MIPALSLPVAIQTPIKFDHTLHTNELQLEAEGKRDFDTEERKKVVVKKKKSKINLVFKYYKE